MLKCIVTASAGILLVGVGAVWIGVLLTENAALLRHLRETEEMLRTERDAAADAEARHSKELIATHARQDEERRVLTEQHDAAVRAVTAEALRTQVDLITQGFRLVPPPGSRFLP